MKRTPHPRIYPNDPRVTPLYRAWMAAHDVLHAHAFRMDRYQAVLRARRAYLASVGL